MNKGKQPKRWSKMTWVKPGLHKVNRAMSDVEGLAGSNAETAFTSQPTS